MSFGANLILYRRWFWCSLLIFLSGQLWYPQGGSAVQTTSDILSPSSSSTNLEQDRFGIFSSHHNEGDSGMHAIPLYTTNRAFSRVKLSQAHKQADKHNLHPHTCSVMPEVTLQNDLTPTHSSTPRNVFPLARFYC